MNIYLAAVTIPFATLLVQNAVRGTVGSIRDVPALFTGIALVLWYSHIGWLAS